MELRITDFKNKFTDFFKKRTLKIAKIYLTVVCLVVNFTVFAQISIEIIKFRDLETFMQKNDSIYVINFWASWCRPCVSEMPVFETLAQEYNPKQVSVIFVSLDFKQNLDVVKKFVTEHQIKSKTYLIDEPDYDAWIDKVSPQWSGAIPATLIFKGNRREFYEQSFDYQTLKAKIKHFF